MAMCLFMAAGALSCSGDDDSKANNNNSSGSGVKFKGSNLDFAFVTVDEFLNYRTEVTFVANGTTSITLYLKKPGNSYQSPADGELSYNADGVNYSDEPNYPDGVVRGYITTLNNGVYHLTSGTIKVEMNSNGKHKFTFIDVEAANDEWDEATLTGTITIEEGSL